MKFRTAFTAGLLACTLWSAPATAGITDQDCADIGAIASAITVDRNALVPLSIEYANVRALIRTMFPQLTPKRLEPLQREVRAWVTSIYQSPTWRTPAQERYIAEVACFTAPPVSPITRAAHPWR